MSDITTLHGCNAIHTAVHTWPRIVALHCSGASGRQWQQLRQVLGSQFNFLAPDLIGCGANPHWSGEHSFTLADEAAPIVSIMDALDMPVHLVGHSYGGGVALRAAVERPHRVASLSLYEPTVFHVLNSMGAKGRAALNEIRQCRAGKSWPDLRSIPICRTGLRGFGAVPERLTGSSRNPGQPGSLHTQGEP